MKNPAPTLPRAVERGFLVRLLGCSVWVHTSTGEDVHTRATLEPHWSCTSAAPELVQIHAESHPGAPCCSAGIDSGPGSSRLCPRPPWLFVWEDGLVYAPSVLAAVQGRVRPHGAPKLVEAGRSGSEEDFKTEAGQEPAACCQDVFCLCHSLFSLFFLFFLFPFWMIHFGGKFRFIFDCVGGVLYERMACSLRQGSCLRLVRISTAALTQQHAMNMCLNGARTKRFGCYHFPSETAALLKWKCFTV